MPLTLGDLAGFTLGDLYEMDFTLGDLGTMNHDDLMKRAYSTVKRFAVAHSQELEDQVRTLEDKYNQLIKSNNGKLKLLDKVSVGVALLSIIVSILLHLSPDKYAEQQIAIQAECNAVIAQHIAVEEAQLEELETISNNISKLLTQSAAFIEQYEKTTNCNESINHVVEHSEDENVPQEIGDAQQTDKETEAAVDDISSQAPELG